MISLHLRISSSFLLCLSVICCGGKNINNRPIIGILTQPTHSAKYGEEYVEATYVRFLEMGGARVVPVRVERPASYYETLFGKINGVLFPGGSPPNKSGPYYQSARHMYDLAVKANDAGDYFPIWGTCLGFETLTVLTANENYLQDTDTENITLPLRFPTGYKDSRLLKDVPDDIVNYLGTHASAQNNHHFGLLLKDYDTISSLHDFLRLVSTSVGRDGKEFVSTLEAYNYPFYGTQWHPEKSVFLWRTDQDIDHSAQAIKASQYFADFFVNEARKSSHHYETTDEEDQALIENYDSKHFANCGKGEAYFFNVTSNSFADH